MALVSLGFKLQIRVRKFYFSSAWALRFRHNLERVLVVAQAVQP